MAVESSLASHFNRGSSGVEVEFNILDRDLQTVTRPFCTLFIAVSAVSPLHADTADGRPVVALDAADSHRLLTFPNPEQLGELYRRGLYSPDVHSGLEAAERALIIENLCAIVDLPMSRVEVRIDEGGDSLDLAIAKVVFREILMLRIYADPLFGRSYSCGEADIAAARRIPDFRSFPSGGPVEEVLALASALIRVPFVTCGGEERPEDIARYGRYLAGFLRDAGGEVLFYDRARNPAAPLRD